MAENSIEKDLYLLDDEDSLEGRYITFILDSENYAFELKYVSEIIGIQRITPVPKTTKFIKGIINLRGIIIPIICLRNRFALKEINYTDRTCIIIVNYKEYTVGLIVDEVNEVVEINSANLKPAPKSGKKTKSQFIQNLSEQNSVLRIMLSLEKVLFKNQYNSTNE